MNQKIITGWNLKSSYLELDPRLFSKVNPVSRENPELVFFNHNLAASLGLETQNASNEELARVFSGSSWPEKARPFAQAYAGHQFGHFTMLGDGRALILGEQLTPKGELFDIQLKGSGQTPYSRRGDGKATLYSMLREYLISEAMYHLGIPTSRSLGVVATGEKVNREKEHEGAVLTRVAASHLRVGTFEYVSRLATDYLGQFLNYAVKRHFPELFQKDEKPITFFREVMRRKISLVIGWLRVGFIHGVMNTDNTTISGETIDYGPCALLNQYNPNQVYSSIDYQGRYAFGNQPSIAYWNMGCLASALLPLMDVKTQVAIEKATTALEEFEPIFKNSWQQMINSKLGFQNHLDGDNLLIDKFLIWMKENHADYTNSFLALEMDDNWCSKFEEFSLESFQKIKSEWLLRVEKNPGGINAAKTIMQSSNPSVIPRNHLVENALAKASEDKNLEPFNELLQVLKNPYQRISIPNRFQLPPSDGDKGYQTFCGT